jgi:hypothetical protein
MEVGGAQINFEKHKSMNPATVSNFLLQQIRRFTIVIAAAFFVLIASCQGENKAGESETATISEDKMNASDSSRKISEPLEADTAYAITQADENYLLVFTHEGTTSDENGTTTFRLVKRDSRDTVFKRTLNFNSVGRIMEPARGHWWFTLENDFGGSGYSGALYNLQLTPEIKLQKLVAFNELSYWKSNRTATGMLFFQAYWDTNTDTDNFEAHFAPHRQQVAVYSIGADTVKVQDLGMTKSKYDLSNNDSALVSFPQQEPELAKRISWSDYY